MSTVPSVTDQDFWPDTSTERGKRFALLIAQNAIQQHDQSLILLNQKIDSIQPVTPGNVIENITQNITNITNSFGQVNNQTGTTVYSLQTTDNGAFIIFDNASAVAVGLTSTLATPFECFIVNLGAGVVTLTPTSGDVNGGATFAIALDGSSVVAFDGVNWWASLNSSGGTETQETPSGTLNGVNLVFTLSNTPNPASSLLVFLNGVEQDQTRWVTLSGSTLTFTVAPKSTDFMRAIYTH